MPELAYQIHSIEVLLPDEEKAHAELWSCDRESEADDLVQIDFKFRDRQITKRADSYFEALQLIRLDLEQQGILLICYGASRNVYPSPMSLSMGDGEKVYKHELGKHGELRNLVSIFDSGSDVIPATVVEQDAFYERWLHSINED